MNDSSTFLTREEDGTLGNKIHGALNVHKQEICSIEVRF